MAESALLKKFLLEYTKLGSRLFRANSGMAWTGKKIGPFKYKQTVTVEKGDVLVKNARPFHGMPKGTSDLVGWTTIRITPDMVGLDMAIYTAFEVKSEGIKTTKEQSAYVRTVRMSGGISCIAKKLEDIFQAVTDFKSRGADNELRH